MKLRNMTAIYLRADDEILLLYRQKSRVGADSWRGIGGHLEPAEINHPQQGALRELTEETKINPEIIKGLNLKYITFRHIDGEIRVNYYYFGDINKNQLTDLSSTEGILAWKKFDTSLLELDMPPTAKAVLEHAIKYPTLLTDEHIYIGTHNEECLFTPLKESLS